MDLDPRQSDVERACTRLVVAYARAVDLGDGAAAAACFTDDGQLDMPGGRSYRGREAIARRIDEQPRDQVSRHILSNLLIEPRGADRAVGALYVSIYRGARPAGDAAVPLDGPYLIGEYEDEYRLDADGWRVARRTLKTIFRRAGGR